MSYRGRIRGVDRPMYPELTSWFCGLANPLNIIVTSGLFSVWHEEAADLLSRPDAALHDVGWGGRQVCPTDRHKSSDYHFTQKRSEYINATA